MATQDELDAARKKVDEEYADVLKNLADAWIKVDAVKRAQPTDDLHELLEDLEKSVHKVRTGGLVGSGAKGHRKALRAWKELQQPES